MVRRRIKNEKAENTDACGGHSSGDLRCCYIFISKNAGKLDSTENDGPNASMGNVTESVLETETETESVLATETTEK